MLPGLKERQSLGLVNLQRTLGDHRDPFTSISDMFDLVNTAIESHREREYTPTPNALRAM